MEYTQWGIIKYNKKVLNCLNPCCNGIYSMRYFQRVLNQQKGVLILVVMEYTQWACRQIFKLWLWVLILVVMEYTQWVCNKYKQ